MTSKENTEAVRRYHERQATRMDQRTSELERAIIRYRARRSARIALKKLESLKNTDGKPLDTEFSSDKIQLPLKSDGGPGSGNFNHNGVPGQVGGSAPAASARGENVPCVGFEHKRTLAWKRKKHGGMYSSMTDSEYEAHAITFLKQKCGGAIDGYLDKDGAICRFDTKTGEFAKGFPGGYVKTCFNPGDSEKNQTFSLERAQRYFDKHKAEEATGDGES